jgi:hypothetical protein
MSTSSGWQGAPAIPMPHPFGSLRGDGALVEVLPTTNAGCHDLRLRSSATPRVSSWPTPAAPLSRGTQ